jgi:hypothetical protein
MTNAKGSLVVVGGATAGSVTLSARRADSYFAGTASSDNTLPRYNVNTFLNSATTRTFPLGSASFEDVVAPIVTPMLGSSNFDQS